MSDLTTGERIALGYRMERPATRYTGAKANKDGVWQFGTLSTELLQANLLGKRRAYRNDPHPARLVLIREMEMEVAASLDCDKARAIMERREAALLADPVAVQVEAVQDMLDAGCAYTYRVTTDVHVWVHPNSLDQADSGVYITLGDDGNDFHYPIWNGPRVTAAVIQFMAHLCNSPRVISAWACY